MDGFISILLVVGFVYLIIWCIKALMRSATHVPTWEGIIISAILGMLPLYLILCFFGIMGEKRYKNLDDTQPHTGNYAEEMKRRYENTIPKNSSLLKYVVVTFLILCLLFVGIFYYSEKRDVETPVETVTSDIVEIEEHKVETSSVVNKKTSIRKQESKRKSSNAEIEKPLVRKTESLSVDGPIQSDVKISRGGNDDSRYKTERKSTLEFMEERSHANAVRQAKEAGVSTEGSTIDILERISHANAVRQAKEAGVSTEGSTIDILERISRKNLEKYYK